MAADDNKKLMLQIDASVELLRRKMGDGDNHVAKFERDTKRRLASIDSSFAGMGKGASAASNAFGVMRGALGAIGISFAVSEMTQLIRSSFELASSIGETAQQLGVSTRALQVYRYIGSQVGIQQEVMDKSLGKLNKTLGEAANGAKKPTEALQRFGFSLEEVRRGLTVEEVIPRLQDGLSGVESSSRRAAVETMFFGRAGQALDTMLGPGSTKINELAAAADHLGIVLSDEQIQKADETADKMEELRTVLSARIASVVIDNAGAIDTLAEALAGVVKAGADAINTMKKFRLEMERRTLQNQINQGDNPPDPAWGLGTWERLSPQQKKSNQRRINEIDAQIANIDKPGGSQQALRGWLSPSFDNYMAGVNARSRPRATPDLDGLSGGGGGSTTRSNEQAFRDFESGLVRRGVKHAPGRYGHRSAKDQNEIYRSGDSPLDGYRRPSRHQAWQAFDPTRASHSDEAAYAAAQEAGLKGFRIVTESRGRKHYEWTGHGGKGDVSDAIEQAERDAEQAKRDAEDAERKRKEALRDQFEQDTELRRAKAAIIQAEQDLSPDYEERNRLALRLLDLDREQEFASLDLSVKLGDRTQAVADQLKADYDTADALRRQKVANDTLAQRAEERAALEAQAADAQRRLLEGQADLATTAAERRRIALRLLDLDYREERARLAKIRDDERAAPGDRERAREGIDQLDERHPQDVERARAGTKGPLEQWRDSIPKTADEINEALQGIAANGLQSVTEGITDAIMGTKSLGQVFKEIARQIIADLLRIAVQRAVLAGLNAAFGGSGGGSDMASGWEEGGLDFFKALGGIFGGSRAIGGDLSPNRIYRVHKDELFKPRVPGTIIPANAVGKGAGSLHVHMPITLSADGADPAQLARLQHQFAEAQRLLPAIATKAVADAFDRRTIR